MKSKKTEQRRRLDREGKEVLRAIADGLVAYASGKICLMPQQASKDAETLRMLAGHSRRGQRAESIVRCCAIRRKIEPETSVTDIYKKVAAVYGVELQTVRNYNNRKAQERAKSWLRQRLDDDARPLPESEKLWRQLTYIEPN
jgi:hypothetical protein